MKFKETNSVNYLNVRGRHVENKNNMWKYRKISKIKKENKNN